MGTISAVSIRQSIKENYNEAVKWTSDNTVRYVTKLTIADQDHFCSIVFKVAMAILTSWALVPTAFVLSKVIHAWKLAVGEKAAAATQVQRAVPLVRAPALPAVAAPAAVPVPAPAALAAGPVPPAANPVPAAPVLAAAAPAVVPLAAPVDGNLELAVAVAIPGAHNEPPQVVVAGGPAIPGQPAAAFAVDANGNPLAAAAAVLPNIPNAPPVIAVAAPAPAAAPAVDEAVREPAPVVLDDATDMPAALVSKGQETSIAVNNNEQDDSADSLLGFVTVTPVNSGLTESDAKVTVDDISLDQVDQTILTVAMQRQVGRYTQEVAIISRTPYKSVGFGAGPVQGHSTNASEADSTGSQYGSLPLLLMPSETTAANGTELAENKQTAMDQELEKQAAMVAQIKETTKNNRAQRRLEAGILELDSKRSKAEKAFEEEIKKQERREASAADFDKAHSGDTASPQEIEEYLAVQKTRDPQRVDDALRKARRVLSPPKEASAASSSVEQKGAAGSSLDQTPRRTSPVIGDDKTDGASRGRGAGGAHRGAGRDRAPATPSTPLAPTPVRGTGGKTGKKNRGRKS